MKTKTTGAAREQCPFDSRCAQREVSLTAQAVRSASEDSPAAFTRRAALSVFALVAGATALPGVFPFASVRPTSRARDVLSVYMDLPYIDTTGTATPYLPAAQCVAPHALLTEEAVRSHHCFM